MEVLKMTGVSRADNSAFRADFYPSFKQEVLPQIEDKQQESRQNKNVPEEVSKLFKNAQESGYSPISFDLFEKDDRGR